MIKRMKTVIASAFLVGLTAAGAVVGQEAPSELPGVFSEVLDVRVINLEVVVTDKDGLPIGGLGAGDFRLLIDGEEVPVDYFSEIRGGVVLEGRSDEETPGVPALGPGEPVGTSYLVFIDEFFSIGVDRKQVLEALRANVARMQPEDRMAVVAFNGKDLDMLTTWSSSVTALERVFRDALARPTYGLQRLAERRQLDIFRNDEFVDLIDFDVNALGAPLFRRELDPEERAYVSRLSDQLNRSVAAATATLRSFARPPGRKVMVLLSGGWPFIPSDYLIGDLSRSLIHRERPYGTLIYGRLAETANLLGYTIYPVDMPGLDRTFLGNAERRTAPVPTSFDSEFYRENEVHYTLRYLARETGGKALLDGNRIKTFETVVSDTRSYYWLGFTPSREWDDRYHLVEIELANPDFRARLRKGFIDSSREREITMAVESTLLFGNAPGGGLVSVTAGDPVFSERNRMEIPIKVTFPLEEITFLPQGDEYLAELEMRVAVLDERGNQAPIPVLPLALRLPEKPAPGVEGSYETRLKLRRRAHDAVVAIHDPSSGKILSAGFAIEP
jgi:VWFA-related protein